MRVLLLYPVFSAKKGYCGLWMTLADCGVFEDMFVSFGLGQFVELCTDSSQP